MTNLALIALLMEWVVVVTTATPLFLRNAMFRSSKPRTTMSLWFFSMLISGALTVVAFGLAVAQAVSFWAQLEAQRDSFEKLAWAFIFSFAPWMLLAAGGIALALISQKLEPLVETQRTLSSSLADLPMVAVASSRVSARIFEIELGSPIAFAGTIASEPKIVFSSALRKLLDEAELDAVLLHEEAHLQAHHQQLKRFAGLIQKLTPGLAASKILVSELGLLCEFAADDRALKLLASNAATANPDHLVSALKKFVNANPSRESQARLQRLATKAN